MSYFDSREDQTRYALAKQAPDMERGFVIETNYGQIEIDADESKEVVAAVEKILRRRIQLFS